MNLREQIKEDWVIFEKGQKANWPLRFLLFGFVILYFIFLWRMWSAVDFFISLFTLHLETALGFYWIKKCILGFYYLLFWFFIHFVIFFVLRPLLLLRKISELQETIKRVSWAFIVVFVSILVSLNPFFLPFSFFIIGIMTYYISFPQKFFFKNIVDQWKVWFVEGGKLFLICAIPVLNVLFLPRLFTRGVQWKKF